MKVIVAGPRDYPNCYFIYDTLEKELSPDDCIITGGATGVDEYAINYAAIRDKQFKVFRADWNTHGKAAGPLRNKQMADYADRLIAFYNGSPGTRNMIKTMASLGKPITIINLV